MSGLISTLSTPFCNVYGLIITYDGNFFKCESKLWQDCCA
nr:MAG TPA: hypothetical protein [Bacteriophage sp.]